MSGAKATDATINIPAVIAIAEASSGLARAT
jgi:hypothetical protein